VLSKQRKRGRQNIRNSQTKVFGQGGCWALCIKWIKSQRKGKTLLNTFKGGGPLRDFRPNFLSFDLKRNRILADQSVLIAKAVQDREPFTKGLEQFTNGLRTTGFLADGSKKISLFGPECGGDSKKFLKKSAELFLANRNAKYS
jgi:hypothetical protein